MNQRNLPNFRAGQGGVILLEALIAILIFSMGILAVIGLQAAAIKNTNDAKYRAEASYLANQIIGKMWVDTTNWSSYSGTQGVGQLPSGERTVTVSGSQVTVTVTWHQPGDDNTHQYIAVAQIAGG